MRPRWPQARAVELIPVSVETRREAPGVTTKSERIIGKAGAGGLPAAMPGSQRLDGRLVLGDLVVEAFGFGSASWPTSYRSAGPRSPST